MGAGEGREREGCGGLEFLRGWRGQGGDEWLGARGRGTWRRTGAAEVLERGRACMGQGSARTVRVRRAPQHSAGQPHGTWTGGELTGSGEGQPRLYCFCTTSYHTYGAAVYGGCSLQQPSPHSPTHRTGMRPSPSPPLPSPSHTNRPLPRPPPGPAAPPWPRGPATRSCTTCSPPPGSPRTPPSSGWAWCGSTTPRPTRSRLAARCRPSTACRWTSTWRCWSRSARTASGGAAARSRTACWGPTWPTRRRAARDCLCATASTCGSRVAGAGAGCGGSRCLARVGKQVSKSWISQYQSGCRSWCVVRPAWRVEERVRRGAVLRLRDVLGRARGKAPGPQQLVQRGAWSQTHDGRTHPPVISLCPHLRHLYLCQGPLPPSPPPPSPPYTPLAGRVMVGWGGWAPLAVARNRPCAILCVLVLRAA